MDKERELNALADVLLILTKELVENPTFAIKDAFKYVHREFVTKPLASEAAYYDFFKLTGKDIRKYDWYGGKVTTLSGEVLNINSAYTAEHMHTGKQFKDQLVSAYKSGKLTKEYIKSILKTRYVCWVTKAEDQRLKELGYNSERPDPEKAYQEAGIVIYRPVLDKNSSFSTTDEAENLQKAAQHKTENPTSTVSIKKLQPQVHKAITYCSKNTFIFTNEMRFNKARKRYGFTTLDKEGRIVAVAAMHEDKRRVAYGQTELCFYDEYKSEFGEWRLVAINKERLSFNKLTNILEAKGSYEATIDPRKGS